MRQAAHLRKSGKLINYKCETTFGMKTMNCRNTNLNEDMIVAVVIVI